MVARKLDVGCGSSKQDGYVGIDILDVKGVDVVWDFVKFPWPSEDNSFDYIKPFNYGIGFADDWAYAERTS